MSPCNCLFLKEFSCCNKTTKLYFLWHSVLKLLMLFNPCLKFVVWPWTKTSFKPAYFSVGEDIYQSLLGSNYVSDESAPTDVILEISTNFYLKPVKFGLMVYVP